MVMHDGAEVVRDAFRVDVCFVVEHEIAQRVRAHVLQVKSYVVDAVRSYVFVPHAQSVTDLVHRSTQLRKTRAGFRDGTRFDCFPSNAPKHVRLLY